MDDERRRLIDYSSLFSLGTSRGETQTIAQLSDSPLDVQTGESKKKKASSTLAGSRETTGQDYSNQHTCHSTRFNKIQNIEAGFIPEAVEQANYPLDGKVGGGVASTLWTLVVRLLTTGFPKQP